MKRLKRIQWLGMTSFIATCLLLYLSNQGGHAWAQLAIKLIGPTGQAYAVTGRNVARGDEALILYDNSYGPSTRTNPYGVEVIAIPSTQASVNGASYQVTNISSIWDCQQKSDLSPCGNATIPPHGIVLSATGSKRSILTSLKPGDVLTAQEDWFHQSQAPVNVINPTQENNPTASGFPGYRGSNQLLVYDSGYGRPTTGTNEFGFEVTVQHGIVTAQEGSDSTIPADGYVISGHGRGRSWLLANTPIGAKVNLDPSSKTLTSIIDFDTYQYQFDRRWAESPCAQNSTDTKCQAILLRKDDAIRQARDGHTSQAVSSLQAALDNLNLRIWESYTPFPATAVRGAWHRPVEKTAAAIGETLDRLQKAGLNSVFLETFFHGYTIFPSQTMAGYGMTSENPKFTGVDLLQLWVEEAHKRNMKVHVWFQTFYAGTRAYLPPGPILEKHPEWANVQYSALKQVVETVPPEVVPATDATTPETKPETIKKETTKPVKPIEPICKPPAANKGKTVIACPIKPPEEKPPTIVKLIAPAQPTPSTLELGGYFLDPANPAVQEFVQKLAEEIVTRYNVDGLQLDYIRYPASFPADRFSYRKTTWGYTDIARNRFKSQYGVDPAEIDPKDPDAEMLWKAWNQFKVDQVTQVVGNISSSLHQKRPSIQVSAAIFPDADAALNQKSQDWRTWGQRGWIDFFAPMTLTSALKVIDRDTHYMIQATNSRVPINAGIFGPFNDNPPELILSQIDTARKAGASGYVLFDTAHLSQQTMAALQISQAPKPQPEIEPAVVQPINPNPPIQKKHWWHFW